MKDYYWFLIKLNLKDLSLINFIKYKTKQYNKL